MAEHEAAPAFVAVTDTPLEVGRAVQGGLLLRHPTVSRQHARLIRQANGLSVLDLESRFGTFVNGVRVGAACAQDGDRIQFGTTITYRVHADGLHLEPVSQGVSLAASAWEISKGGRILVRDVGFAVAADSFVGILGPSGAGKSTVLNCLAGYRRPDRGRLTFDGCHDAAAEPELYRALLGHVPQEAIDYPTLTLRENLQYAALLRLEAERGEVTADEAIEQALERLGLADHQDKPAGVLSGGQRKRLNVAFELLKRPRLLLLDEPTSGLDPASEANLMEQLQVVARRGTTVVCTTHLMDNLRLFDQVIVLGVAEGVGHVAYQGSPGELLDHFQCRNFADLYERLEQGQFSHESSMGPPATPTTAAFPANPPLAGPRGTGSKPDHSGSQSQGVSLQALVAPMIDSKGWSQANIVGWRALRLVLRDRWLGAVIVAQPVVLGLLACLAQFDAGSLAPIHFFCVIIALWMGMNNSARDLVKDRKVYVRERLAGLRPESYLAAKGAVFFLVGMVQLLLLLMIVRTGCRLVLVEHLAHRLQETSLIWTLLVLAACYGCGLGLGLLVSTLAKTEEAAIAALPLLIMPQILLSVVAVGEANVPHTKERAFRPLVVTLCSPGSDVDTGQSKLPATGVLVDVVSLVCYSRPATLLLESPSISGFGWLVGFVDFCHLTILLLGTWTVLYWAYLRAEEKWPRLIGLG
jgi:ABC-type multidrug transport system ATPase subunit